MAADSTNTGTPPTPTGWGRRDRVLYALLSAGLLAALIAFGRHWTTVPDWIEQPLGMGLLTVVGVLFVGQFVQAWTTLPLMRRPTPPEPSPDLRVAVVTTFVPGLEAPAMLEATVRAMNLLPEADDVWVLDEGDDPEVRALCRRLGARHFSRRGNPDAVTERGRLRAGTKYGNLNAWLDSPASRGYDVIAAFDPDHVPKPNFLTRTLGYLDDPAVGFVQAAQVYYNQDAGLVARGAAEETYAYYSSTLPAAAGAGYTPMVGCHNVHRAAALRAIGGWAPHDADDLLTGLHYDCGGWLGVYVPEVLAVGLTPAGWSGYWTQQRRWARSVFDIKLRHLPRLWPRLRPTSRWFALLQGAAYPIEAALPLLGPLVLIWVLATGQSSLVGHLVAPPMLALLLALAGVDLFRQRFFLVPERERGFHWRAGLLRATKWPFVAWGLFEAVVGRERRYEVTPKSGGRRRSVVPSLPHLVLGLAVAGVYGDALVSDGGLHWSLHLWSPLVAGASLGIFTAALRRAPSDFDPGLLPDFAPRPDRGDERRRAD